MSTPRSSINFAASDTSLVSPIEATFGTHSRVTVPDSQPKSQLPRPSGVPRPVQPVSHQNKDKVETKWDTYSGEPTNAESGKPAQTRPGATQPVEMQYPQLKERTKQILAGLRDRGQGQSKAAWGRAPPPVAADPLDQPPVQRQPWKGASGRETIVAPVKNTADARTGPLKHPQRNVSKMDPAQDRARTASPEVGYGNQGTGSKPAAPQVSHRTYATQPKSQPSPRPDLSIKMVPEQEEIKPVAPLKVKSPRVVSPAEVQNISSLQSPFQSPHPFKANNALSSSGKTDTDTRHHRAVLEPQQGFGVSAGDAAKRPNETSHQLGTSHLENEPRSHLSWTTYATTANDSPDSLAPTHLDSSPVPPLPSTSSPLIIRKRPISTAANSLPFSNPEAAGSRASIISRKPIPKDLRSTSVMSSASKSLPPTPIEMQAGDKISSHEARLEDLGMRRRNNQKIIRELQESLKKNAIVYSMMKRMEVEKQIANLKEDLADITREEHEVGLHLHRAQKKRDREECYENPTGLWIKRVTT